MNQKLAEDVTEITYSAGYRQFRLGYRQFRLFLRRRLFSTEWNVIGKRLVSSKDVTERTGFRLHRTVTAVSGSVSFADILV